MKKRLTAFVIAMSILFGVAQAQKFEYIYKGIEFKCKLEDGKAVVTAFDVKATNVTIPAKVTYMGMEYSVGKVSTFMNGVNYLTVFLTVEEGIEDIDKYAFVEFRKLQTVSLPSTIRHIGKNAFRDNKATTFNMLSSIDEQTIRRGGEMWPTGEGTMMASNVHTERLKDEPRMKEEQRMQEQKELEKQLEEQKRLLAQVKKEQEKLLAENQREEERRKAEEKRREYEEEKANNPSKGGLFSKSLLGGVFGSKNSKGKNQQSVETDRMVATNGPVEPALPPVDVDMDIPVSNTTNDNTYCVIIANEHYEDVPVVDYASRDGEIFKEYCMKTLGIPEKQIRTYIDASYTDIRRALNWMNTMADVTDGNSKMIFYYAGHGIPNEKDKTAYLIPTDGFPKDVTTCFKLSELYSMLGKLRTKSVTVFLDACFSGVERGSTQALVAARGVAIKPKTEVLTGNMVVFSATSDDETALAYQSKRHGMFTYFLLDQLKQTKGKITFGELFTKISQDVKKNSMLENDKLQTPSVNVSARMKNSWKSLQF